MGLVDVKNTWIEPPELVAERLRSVLKQVRSRARLQSRPIADSLRTARHITVAEAEGDSRRERAAGPKFPGSELEPRRPPRLCRLLDVNSSPFACQLVGGRIEGKGTDAYARSCRFTGGHQSTEVDPTRTLRAATSSSDSLLTSSLPCARSSSGAAPRGPSHGVGVRP